MFVLTQGTILKSMIRKLQDSLYLCIWNILGYHLYLQLSKYFHGLMVDEYVSSNFEKEVKDLLPEKIATLRKDCYEIPGQKYRPIKIP